ncbi:hypothetical protein [Paracandidimonas lactea]|uniref:hypothetical protein n=1 Tax=Paracandidimonas lactea TaxID=2895524 RepID=UPI001EF13AA9|nr:hypothetical protein [Paracandidimonas lactea]
MQRALSLDNSPPASVPLRFMLSAPVFMMLAGLLLLASPQALLSRWTPQALALTHLLTLGALAHTMAGAMMQILPVATGIHVLAPRLTASITHVSLSGGTLLLAAAFLIGTPWLFGTGAALLVAGLAWLAMAVACGLWRHRAHAAKGAGEILAGVRLALLALLVTIVIGAVLSGHPAASLPAPRQYTGLHAAWGLLGWVGLLVMAMSYQLIPMFQVTELYPRPITRWLTPCVCALLAAKTLAWIAHAPAWVELVLVAALAATYLAYVGVTLHLLCTRKRPEPDTTTLFWFMGISSLALCAVLWLAQYLTGIDMSVTLGVLFLAGFAWSVINGMLYKIIPFLTWFHAQRGLPMALPFIPKVKQVIPDARAQGQFYAQLAALILLAAASLLPAQAWLTGAAGLAQAVSAAWLLAYMVGAIRLLHSTRRKVRAALAPHTAGLSRGSASGPQHPGS